MRFYDFKSVLICVNLWILFLFLSSCHHRPAYPEAAFVPAEEHRPALIALLEHRNRATETLLARGTLTRTGEGGKETAPFRAGVRRPSDLALNIYDPLALPVLQAVIRDGQATILNHQAREYYQGPMEGFEAPWLPQGLAPEDWVAMFCGGVPEAWIAGAKEGRSWQVEGAEAEHLYRLSGEGGEVAVIDGKRGVALYLRLRAGVEVMTRGSCAGGVMPCEIEVQLSGGKESLAIRFEKATPNARAEEAWFELKVPEGEDWEEVAAQEP